MKITQTLDNMVNYIRELENNKSNFKAYKGDSGSVHYSSVEPTVYINADTIIMSGLLPTGVTINNDNNIIVNANVTVNYSNSVETTREQSQTDRLRDAYARFYRANC